jgi:hypothetical protein
MRAISWGLQTRDTLVPGVDIDQHHGIQVPRSWSYFQVEHYDDRAVERRFDSSSPLSGANRALTWLVFVGDREKSERSRGLWRRPLPHNFYIRALRQRKSA